MELSSVLARPLRGPTARRQRLSHKSGTPFRRPEAAVKWLSQYASALFESHQYRSDNLEPAVLAAPSSSLLGS